MDQLRTKVARLSALVKPNSTDQQPVDADAVEFVNRFNSSKVRGVRTKRLVTLRFAIGGVGEGPRVGGCMFVVRGEGGGYGRLSFP